MAAATAIATMKTASIVVDAAPPHRVHEASPAFLAAFGYREAAQVAGRSVRMLHGPGTSGRGLLDVVEHALAGKGPQRTLAALYSTDGALQLVSVVARQGDDGRCVIDMQRSGAVSSKEAQMTLDDGTCNMMLSSEKQQIQDVSDAFTARYGLSIAAARGRSINVILGPGSDAQTLHAMLARARGGLVQRGAIVTYGSDCSEQRSMVTATPVHDNQGRVSHVMLALETESSARRRSLDCSRAMGSFRRVPSVSSQTRTWRGALTVALLVLALPGLLRMHGPMLASGHAGVGVPLWPGRLFASHTGKRDCMGLAPRAETEPDLVLERPQSRGGKLTLMLDLDKTVLYGNDGNDLGVALQWMDKTFAKVEELYKQLINPSLKKVYDFYVQQGKQVEVVIYTRRPQIVYYKSCVSQNTVPVRYAEDWHDQGQIYFPSHVQTSQDILATYAGPELVEDEMHDVKMSLDRLLAARNAVVNELGLSSMPPVVVTAEAKNTDATAQYFNVPLESCLLFDDNIELRNNPQVVLVEPLESLPAARRKQLLDFMQRELPAERLEEDLVEYLEEARPDEMSIKRDANNQLTWWVPEAKGELRGWRTPIPSIVPPCSGSCRALPLKAGAKSLRTKAQKTEPGSNVSPADIPLRSPGNGLIDLRAAAEKAALMRMADIRVCEP